MLIQEDNAIMKWCPMRRVSNKEVGEGYNSTYVGEDLLDTEVCWCIGADCMMWRWASDLKSTDVGYCGLAGKPVDRVG